MVRFRFKLTAEEYYQFHYYTAWAAPEKKQYRLMYFLRVMFFYGAVAILYILSSRSHLLWIDISVFIVIGLIYLLMVPVFIRWSIRRRVKDILSKKENQHVLDEAEIILSETGIADSDIVSESRYEWDAIVHYADTPDFHYLYTNTYYAIVIPKRVILNTAEKMETEKLLATHLPLQA